MSTLEQAIIDALPSKGFKQIRERFLSGCENNPQNQNFNSRKFAVATQINRDSWMIEDKFGKIRINKKKRLMPKLEEGHVRYTILPDGTWVEANQEEYSYHISGSFHVLGAIGDRLTKEEYEELLPRIIEQMEEYEEMEKAYMADFPFDEEYLKSLMV